MLLYSSGSDKGIQTQLPMPTQAMTIKINFFNVLPTTLVINWLRKELLITNMKTKKKARNESGFFVIIKVYQL